MNLKCIENHEAATTGFLGLGGKPRSKIIGLTLGKQYVGQFVPIVYSVMNQGTTINQEDIKVMIFNDEGQWETYEPNLFEPA